MLLNENFNNNVDSKLFIKQIIHELRKITKKMTKPMVTTIVEKFGKNPFLILISCLLSLRARDTVTLPICLRLFSIAKTPQEILKIPINELEKILYSLGFYKRKAKLLHSISKEILEKFNGKVPSNLNSLLSLKGVGRKTANLVLAQGYDIPAICVDTHVHRISNLLGIVKTKTPLQTELELQKILPKKYWSEWNSLLVVWGQNVCVPNSPTECKKAISELYKNIGIK